MYLKACLHCNLNLGWTRVTHVRTELSFDKSESNPGWSQPTFWCGLKWVQPRLTEVWLFVSDCIHVCACASAVHSKEMMGRQQRGYSLVFGVQPMCRASLHVQSFEDFTKVSSSPRVLPMHIRWPFGSLWRIVSAMASNSGGSSSNAIARSDRHMALIMNNELPWTS